MVVSRVVKKFSFAVRNITKHEQFVYSRVY